MNSYLWAFSGLAIFRYLRLVVNIISFFCMRPIPIPTEPALNERDATVVIPTCFEVEYDVVRCLKTVASCSPARIIIVTSSAKVNVVQQCCDRYRIKNIQVLGVPELDKRNQIVKALPEVKTRITVFADDDVLWPSNLYLRYLLAAFEDPGVGAAGTLQRVRRGGSPNLFKFLGICYLERRNFNTGATNNIDGAVSTLSGRTAAHRTEVVQNEAFYNFFTHDKFLGQRLNSDDDKCLTRWTYSHGWKIQVQSDKRAVLETTLESNRKFFDQCFRWARAHWRGNFTVMTTTRYWWTRHPWTLYAIYIGQFQTPAALWDGILMGTLLAGTASWAPLYKYWAIGWYTTWLLFTKVVKILPHLFQHPSDLKFLPAAIAFSYIHGWINIWALCTLKQTHWGSRDLEAASKALALARPNYLKALHTAYSSYGTLGSLVPA
ncbi:MAG: hypothetical protein M1820_007425 [Bogoriella megaspora]|nr:MAG: hypothetical protein M1820_007425 [Bogoriella megaspora]